MSGGRYVIIVGCGRVGSMLANQLSREGNAVVVIDKDEEKFQELSAEFSGFRIAGNAVHLAVLRDAKVQQADVLIATTHYDNVNLMVAQVAQQVFRVPLVLARVFDPKREEVYARMGIRTICPTSVGVELFLRAVGEPHHTSRKADA